MAPTAKTRFIVLAKRGRDHRFASRGKEEESQKEREREIREEAPSDLITSYRPKIALTEHDPLFLQIFEGGYGYKAMLVRRTIQ